MSAIVRASTFGLNVWIGMDAASLNQSAESQTSKLQEVWQRSCELLAANLKADNTDFRRGIFSSTECIIESQNFSEEKWKDHGSSFWLLQIFDAEKAKEIKLFHYYNSTPYLEATVALSKNVQLEKILVDQEMNRLIAASIMDQMPMSGRLYLKGLQQSIESGKEFGIEGVTIDEFMIYSLNLQDEPYAWLPRPLGTAKAKSEESELKQEWQLFLHKDIIKSDEMYFLHNIHGRGKKSPKILEKLNILIDKLQDEAGEEGSLSSMNAKDLGVRIGYPIVEDGSIMSNSYLLGISLELNNGKAKGVRWFWDYAPLVKQTDGEIEAYFTWNRISLGWAFDVSKVQAETRVFDHIELVPRFGVFTIDAKIPFPFQGIPEYDGINVRSKNVFDFGLELNGKRSFFWGSIRLWASFNYYGLYSLTNQHSVDGLSYRGGLETYFNSPDFLKKWRLHPYAFASGEHVYLNFVEGSISELSQAEVSKVKYKLAFLGGGLVFRW